MRRWVVLAALLLAMTAAMPAWAGDDEDCSNVEKLAKTEPARVLAACRRLADQGRAPAQLNLGLMYHYGDGVPQDYAEAVEWYQKAADQGEAEAQYNLGTLYYNGQGAPQD